MEVTAGLAEGLAQVTQLKPVAGDQAYVFAGEPVGLSLVEWPLQIMVSLVKWIGGR